MILQPFMSSPLLKASTILLKWQRHCSKVCTVLQSLWITTCRRFLEQLTFNKDFFNMWPHHDSAAILFYSSSQCIHNAASTSHGIINCAARSVTLHQHERHFSTDCILCWHAATTQQNCEGEEQWRHTAKEEEEGNNCTARSVALHQHECHFGTDCVLC